MNRPPWLSERSERREQNRRSAEQERKRAVEIGGRRQPGSGSSRRKPEDVISPTYLEQLKFTDALSFRVDSEQFRSQCLTAVTHGKQARLIIEFGNGFRVAVTEA